MLQQTRIEAVIPYFERFMSELPTVEALARVDADRLMKLWEGLGYYSRARNLKTAACQMMERHSGELPRTVAELRALAGIGEYTAGAIASIAYGVATPAVDGNVLRVLARLTACEDDVLKPSVKKELTALASALVPREDPGSFNQALMELGERVCLPNTMPRCEACPIAAHCAVGGTELAMKLPVRVKKKPRTVEQKTVMVLLTNESTPRVLLHRRDANGLLADLWELPNTDGHAENPPLPVAELERVSDWMELTAAKHIFTHKEWHMTGVLAVVKPTALPEGYEFVDAKALETDRALPTAFRAYAQMLPIWLKGETV